MRLSRRRLLASSALAALFGLAGPVRAASRRTVPWRNWSGALVAISVHQAAANDYRPYFDLIEPIFWKYGGRPHWGKVHSLGHDELVRLYPRFRDFLDIRAALDPGGRLLNDHLRRLFGLAGSSGSQA